ncbi:MAG: hypothetical protein AAF632_09975 [Bacteroidota bacterium]
MYSKIVQDVLCLIGLDIVGNKPIGINVFSPGGMMSAGNQQGTRFFLAVMEAMEKKVYYREIHDGRLSNQALAIME